MEKIIRNITNLRKMEEEDYILFSEIINRLNNTKEEMALLFIMLNPLTYTGKHALIYNRFFDSYIKNKDENKLIEILKPVKTYFIELFDNENLNENEYKKIEKIFMQEYYSMLSLIENMENCELETINKMYNECFKKICFIENNKYICNYFPDIIFIVENNKIYPFKYNKLIENFCRNIKINHYENREFTEETINNIYNKYGQEIKMFLRYLSF